MFRKIKPSRIEVKVDCEHLFREEYCEYYGTRIKVRKDCKECPYYVSLRGNRECYEGEK